MAACDENRASDFWLFFTELGELCVQVWASKWSERAWLSRRARGVKDGDLYMAVLLQQVDNPRLAHSRSLLQAHAVLTACGILHRL